MYFEACWCGPDQVLCISRNGFPLGQRRGSLFLHRSTPPAIYPLKFVIRRLLPKLHSNPFRELRGKSYEGEGPKQQMLKRLPPSLRTIESLLLLSCCCQDVAKVLSCGMFGVMEGV